jgi:nucleotide-binding universal stress UspA family protein
VRGIAVSDQGISSYLVTEVECNYDSRRPYRRIGRSEMSQPTRGKIVVGIDGSPSSHRALLWAVKEAELRGAEVQLVYGVNLYLTVHGMPTFPTTHVRFPYDVEDAGRKLLDGEIASLGPVSGGLVVRGELVELAPAAALIDQSQGAELLVVGSRGSGGFRGLMLGAVAQQCVQHAHCPVVVVGPHSEVSAPAEKAAVGEAIGR